jgi:hypothetical protein
MVDRTKTRYIIAITFATLQVLGWCALILFLIGGFYAG